MQRILCLSRLGSPCVAARLRRVILQNGEIMILFLNVVVQLPSLALVHVCFAVAETMYFIKRNALTYLYLGLMAVFSSKSL